MREKEHYRDYLLDLHENGVPRIMSKGKAAEILGISRTKLYRLIAEGEIKLKGNQITDGEIARYLCG